MANFKKYNISNDEVWKIISEIITGYKKLYKKVRIRCVAFRENESGDYQNVLCLIKAFTEEPCKYNQIKGYGQIFLLENWYEIDNNILYNLFHDEKNSIILRNIPAKPNLGFYGGDIIINLAQPLTFNGYSFESFDNEYSESSGYLFIDNNQLSNKINKFDLGQPMLSYENPLYMSYFQAIQEWTELKNFHNGSDGRLGKVVIFLPSVIAGFRNINKINGKLTILSRLSDNNLKNYIKIKVLWITNGQRFNQEIGYEDKTAFDIPDNAESVYLYLMGSKGDVYDYYQETIYWSHIERKILGVSSIDDNNNKIIINALQTAENENTEFKPFMKIGDNKWNEIIKTVIALMNTHGGNIIIGISNEVYLEGIEKLLAKEYYENNKNSSMVPNDQIEWYKGIIKKNIGDKLSGSLRPTIEHLIYNGHTLIIIKVVEGHEKPYYNFETKDIYVRRGSNNKKPDPDLELPELLKGKLIPQNTFNLGGIQNPY